MKCRLCLNGSVDLYLDFGRQPIVHNLLSRVDDSYDSYPFKVGYCESCGFLQLVDYIKPEHLYRNYFTVSGWKNQPHAPRLLQLIEGIFDLNPASRIVELGCNDGGFLDLLGRNGYANTLGLEPSQDAFELARKRGINVVNRFFGRDAAIDLAKLGRTDLVISRQVLEHIPDLHDFLTAIHDILEPDGGLVLELPDHSMNYQTLDYTFWEEHVNYFTYNTVSSVLALTGFEIIHHETTLFSGKAMLIFAHKKRTGKRPQKLRNLDAAGALNYRQSFLSFRKESRDFLSANSDGGLVMYGAGARSCNFVNLLDFGDFIEAFIDDQPEKQDKFVPGCRKIIRSFDEVGDGQKFVLLGVNTENENTVIRKRKLKKFASVLPPSRHLPAYWQELIALAE